MPLTAILFGIGMIGYGVFLFAEANWDPQKKTALIPAIFGAVFLILGAVSLVKDSIRKHAMHLAAAVALFGCLCGLGMGVPKHRLITGELPKSPEAVQAQIWLGVLCGLFLALCVKSFIDTRKARKAQAGNTPSA
jgi:hypothetical protein